MMMSLSQPKLEIVICDNGYVVEWHDQRDLDLEKAGNFAKSYGAKIFITKRELLKYIDEFFP